MTASEQGLKFIYKKIRANQEEGKELANEWKEEAISCTHCIGEGGDGLECRHPTPGDDDPFCYPSRCPLIK